MTGKKLGYNKTTNKLYLKSQSMNNGLTFLLLEYITISFITSHLMTQIFFKIVSFINLNI
jgi:hypothetical protein